VPVFADFRANGFKGLANESFAAPRNGSFYDQIDEILGS
jgi:hypothetical protein